MISLILLTLSVTMNQLSRRSHAGLENTRSIQVSAEDVIYEVPDEAEIVFTVVTREESYTEATRENSSRMESVIQHLKEEGLKEEDLKTENFSVSPRYEEVEEGRRVTREVVGYEVENNLRVTVRELSLIDGIIGGAIDAGANKVYGLQFLVSNEEELKKEVRSSAIAKAKSEAEEVARDLGVGLGRVLSFSESQRFYPQRDISREMGMEVAEEAPEVPIEPGETEIVSSVTVTFEIR